MLKGNSLPPVYAWNAGRVAARKVRDTVPQPSPSWTTDQGPGDAAVVVFLVRYYLVGWSACLRREWLPTSSM
jgi:hypothetical protein